MYKEEIYISEEYRLRDYLGLNLKMNSCEDTWEMAINIFINRIYGRYFDAIDKLAEGGVEEMSKYAFAIMSIECILIDTFAKFRYGPNQIRNAKKYNYEVDKYRNNNIQYKKLVYYKYNESTYTKFLRQYCNLTTELSTKFYKDIRCSILHFGSTENTSRLTCNSSEAVTIVDKEDICVDINIMNESLKKYFDDYIQELKNGKDEIRKNFILGMNYLCGMHDKNIE